MSTQQTFLDVADNKVCKNYCHMLGKLKQNGFQQWTPNTQKENGNAKGLNNFQQLSSHRSVETKMAFMCCDDKIRVTSTELFTLLDIQFMMNLNECSHGIPLLFT